MPVEEVTVGTRFAVRPGERIALDGEVVAGASSVDEAPITGESVPVDKEVGSTVFAGTLNAQGALTVRVTKAAEDSEVGHPGEEALGEAAVELVAHGGIPVQLGVVVLPLAQALVERARGVGSDLRALLEVPGSGRLVESVDGVLVDDQPARRAQQAHDLVERARKVGDVVKRQAGHDRVERIGSSEVLERGGLEDVPGRCVGVDRHHCVSGFCDCAREVTAATAHLEDPGRRRGEVLGYERVQVPRLSR
jgi:hypothetical protein